MCCVANRLVIIGGGSAGCQAALYAAKAGMQVELYEPDKLGGTCLHTGCIPTKALLHAVDCRRSWTELTNQIHTKLSLLESGMSRQLRRAGVQLRRERVELACLPEADAVILAIGGYRGPLMQIPGKQVYDHRTILDIPQLPPELAIIGGGISGLEFAQIFASLGCRVTVYEREAMILPGIAPVLAQRLLEICQQEGVEFVCGEKTEPQNLPQECIFWAAGSGPWPEEYLKILRQVNIQAGPDGIAVDDTWKTTAPHIYAVGDCTDRTRTAFAANFAACCAVDAILGRPTAPVGVIPKVVCGWYDLVSVGDWAGLSVCQRFDRSGYAFVHDRMDGMIRLVCDARTGVLTGAHLLYPGAAETGSVLAAAINTRMPVQTLAQTLFYHPAYAETIKDAAVELYDLFRKQTDRPCL